MLVDMGTTMGAGITGGVNEYFGKKIKEIIGDKKISNIFLSHPDHDHTSFFKKEFFKSFVKDADDLEVFEK